jgi:putative signal transducing protein
VPGVRLMVVADSMEADVICGLLRTEGIACDHRHTDMGAGAGDAIGTAGPREILVRSEDLARAQELVAAPGDPDDAPADAGG